MIKKLNVKQKIKKKKQFKAELAEIVEDCLLDIKNYIVTDVMKLLERKGIIYAKNKKKNSKKKAKKKKT